MKEFIDIFYNLGSIIILGLIFIFAPEKLLIPTVLYFGLIIIIQILFSIKQELQNRK